MAFYQSPPQLENAYESDPLVKEYVARHIPSEHRQAFESECRELGELSVELHSQLLSELELEPVHTQWDPWGNRIDHVEVTPLWKRAQGISARYGLVGAGYEPEFGSTARTRQFILNYLVQASTDVYSCPLAMTDGAAATLLAAGNEALIDRAVSRLTSRDPKVMWTSGQWMTERTGGSDVGLSETVAKKSENGWRLYGTKWFTSAITADMALTLARPEGNGPGGRGLAMFYVELRDQQGALQGIRVNRLKNKLGTRKVPTAELTLDGTPATPVFGTDSGTRNIAPMLAVTRTWNAVASAWGMRRAFALALDFAKRRVAFGAPLIDKPLHRETLGDMAAETQAAFLLAFRSVELLGKSQHGSATESEVALLRTLTPIVKLTTAKQAVAVASETLEAFGGAGYVEDTGLPRILADAQVLPIWEGTTNVLSLDLLRALAKGDGIDALASEMARLGGAVDHPELAGARDQAQQAFAHAAEWVGKNQLKSTELEAGARRFALTCGRSLELALLAEHAQWCVDHAGSKRAIAAARRFARSPIDLICEFDDAAELLA